MQNQQRPQEGDQFNSTLAPGCTLVTPGPTVMTVPAASWPRTAGTGWGSVPFASERSEGQAPAGAGRGRPAATPGRGAPPPRRGGGGPPPCLARGEPTDLRTAARIMAASFAAID